MLLCYLNFVLLLFKCKFSSSSLIFYYFSYSNFDAILTQLKPVDINKIVDSLPSVNVESIIPIESEFQPRNKPPSPGKPNENKEAKEKLTHIVTTNNTATVCSDIKVSK